MRLYLFLLAGLLLGPGTSGFALKSTLSKVLESYYGVQKNLANDKLDGISDSGTALKITIEKSLAQSSSKDESRLLKDLIPHLAELIAHKDLKSSRVTFGNISKLLVEYLKSHVEETQRVQLFFCPMFPQGYAFWVQPKGEKLTNPYWGHEMLTCGVKRPW